MLKKVQGRALLTGIGLFGLVFLLPSFAVADQSDVLKEPKARLSTKGSGTLTTVKLSPLSLQGGSQLTIESPQRWSNLSIELLKSLRKTHEVYTKLFGEIPRFESSIRLMDEDTFFLTTGAPRWTNAMYYRGEIIIPLSYSQRVDLPNIYRSLRHEYMHAVIHALSAGRAPGWLDEGLAQWSEGDENPALQPALYEWLNKHEPLNLSLLQGGFTRLDASMVPAAYAQSLFAANTVVNTYGFSPIRHYFDGLRSGLSKEEAFNRAFNLDESGYESKLGQSLKVWQKSYAEEPPDALN